MPKQYDYDVIDGRRVPPLVVVEDYELVGIHNGTVHVEAGQFILSGMLNGSLDVQAGASAIISGAQNGSVSVASGVQVLVRGAINGSVHVARGGVVIIEAGGRLAGSLHNDGVVLVRGEFGGSRSGSGDFRLEGDGSVKQPTVRNGARYYDWS